MIANPRGQSQYDVWDSPDMLIRIKRPDGTTGLLRVPAEHWERVLALCEGEFKDTSLEKL